MSLVETVGEPILPGDCKIRTKSGNLCRFYGTVSQLAFSYPFYGYFYRLQVRSMNLAPPSLVGEGIVEGAEGCPSRL
jgi:hypothetical protein